MKALAAGLTAFVLALTPTQSNAEGGVTVGEMMAHCQKPDGDFFKTYCFTYVGAVVDVQITFTLADASGTKRACLPEWVLAREAAAIFVDWADRNPASRNLPAATGVVESLVSEFPCSTG